MRYAISAAMLMLAAASPALADRGPNPEELQKITAALKAAGYVSWDTVELTQEGPHWTIVNARKGDGSKWAVKLRPTTLGVLSADRDED